jgi:hypothetical protein
MIYNELYVRNCHLYYLGAISWIFGAQPPRRNVKKTLLRQYIGNAQAPVSHVRAPKISNITAGPTQARLQQAKRE